MDKFTYEAKLYYHTDTEDDVLGAAGLVKELYRVVLDEFTWNEYLFFLVLVRIMTNSLIELMLEDEETGEEGAKENVKSAFEGFIEMIEKEQYV